MLTAQIQFAPWDKIYNFSVGDLAVRSGDKVIVKTEIGTDMGEVVGICEINENEFAAQAVANRENSGHDCQNCENAKNSRELKPILRLATKADLDKMPGQEEIDETVRFCKRTVDKYQLSMKLVDARYSFDNSRITFAFIADGRVDFRELVKELTRHYGRTVRLQQIGIRDEAKLKGDYGHCGRSLCCQGFLGELASITSEMAEVQQCVHRGSDRISGVCGRLMCCLGYEYQGYQEMAKTFPPIGAKVDVDGKKGIVVGHHILKKSVDVEFMGDGNERGGVAEVLLDRNKRKEKDAISK